MIEKSCPKCNRGKLKKFSGKTLMCDKCGATVTSRSNAGNDLLYNAAKEAGFMPLPQPEQGKSADPAYYEELAKYIEWVYKQNEPATLKALIRCIHPDLTEGAMQYYWSKMPGLHIEKKLVVWRDNP